MWRTNASICCLLTLLSVTRRHRQAAVECLPLVASMLLSLLVFLSFAVVGIMMFQLCWTWKRAVEKMILLDRGFKCTTFPTFSLDSLLTFQKILFLKICRWKNKRWGLILNSEFWPFFRTSVRPFSSTQTLILFCKNKTLLKCPFFLFF